MSEIKPNHICKNTNCHKGIDGGRKHYYACNTCDKRNNWRSVACSLDCYDEYQKQVLEARSRGISVNILPDRTDMTLEEIKERIIDADENGVSQDTMAELSEYKEVIEEVGLPQAIDKINEDLDGVSPKTKRSKKAISE